MNKKYWLFKSEPSEFSIDDFNATNNFTIEWFGVRNYQVRNFMRDKMQVGDLGFFWHSSCKYPGIYGIVEICSKAHPDSSQFDLHNKYYDPKSSIENPRWVCVDVKFVSKLPYISIQKLRLHQELANMQVLKQGNRLSITELTLKEWQFINSLAI